MNENQVRALIQQQSQASAFNVPNVPFHVHNGVDAPIVYSPVNIYTGYIPSDADLTGATTNGFVFFPQGWTVEYDSGSGVYTVTHNLGTDFYTVACTLYGPESIVGYSPNVVCLSNQFAVVWQSTLGVPAATDFTFQLVQVNNNYQTIPQYTAQGGVGS